MKTPDYICDACGLVKANCICKTGLSESRDVSCSEHWHVEVSVNGETVLVIGHNFLSGVDDIHEHAETIRTAANHLLGFIGDAQNKERQRMTSTVQDLVGLPLTIRVDWDKEWKAAICEELEVSGFGETLDDALAAVARSIRSAIACKANVGNEARL